MLAGICFGLAVLHTFLVRLIQKGAHRLRKGSRARRVVLLLGEVELVFAFWAIIYVLARTAIFEDPELVRELAGLSFAEPLFVLAVMVICSSKPILSLAARIIQTVAGLLPGSRQYGFFAVCLILGPLSGSLITEPAAMTVTALILLDHYYRRGMSQSFMHATLGLLFVNVSIGGTLTPYAAPPVLMVASKWGWGLSEMFWNFGWKAALAITLSTSIVIFWFRRELGSGKFEWKREKSQLSLGVTLVNFLFLGGTILAVHQPAIVVALLAGFWVFSRLSARQQGMLQIREAVWVAAFLSGLVVLGAPQRWWLEPLLGRLGTLPLFAGSIALTAVTDNAALTYLGSLVPSLSEAARYALVAGAVAGGGLTVIANAPNPAGYGILNPAFGEDGISPGKLFLHALFPTAIAALCFWFL